MYVGLDHIAIRVKDLDTAIRQYEKLGFTLERQGRVESLGIRQAIFALGNSRSFIELVEPIDPNKAVGKALERYGEGIHTVAVSVDDLTATVTPLKEAGVNVILPDGDEGTAFVHPKETYGVLLQLVKLH